MAACSLAHDDVAVVVVDDDSDADFWPLGFCHFLFLNSAGVVMYIYISRPVSINKKMQREERKGEKKNVVEFECVCVWWGDKDIVCGE